MDVWVKNMTETQGIRVCVPCESTLARYLQIFGYLKLLNACYIMSPDLLAHYITLPPSCTSIFLFIHFPFLSIQPTIALIRCRSFLLFPVFVLR